MELDEAEERSIYDRFKEACQSGDRERLKELCVRNPSLVTHRFAGDQDEVPNCTGLHFAVRAKKNRATCCLVLLEAGADLEAKDAHGRTPLLAAFVDGRRYDSVVVVEVLLSRGTNVHVRDAFGRTVVHFCALYDFLEVLGPVLAAGAGVDEKDNEGRTPLMYAASTQLKFEQYQDKIVLQLVRCGADVNAQDKLGLTPLHYCVGGVRKKGFLEFDESEGLQAVVDVLYRCALEFDHEKDLEGKIAFLFSRLVLPHPVYSLFDRIFERVKFLLEPAVLSVFLPTIDLHDWLTLHVLNSHLEDRDNVPPLAVRKPAPEPSLHGVMKVLLAEGANPLLCSLQSGRTPCDIARRNVKTAQTIFLQRAEIEYRLIKAGGASVPPEEVTLRIGGPPYAGKSTLAKSLQVTRLGSYVLRISQLWRRDREEQPRTKGISCQKFVDGNSCRFTVLDLGGQGEFLATHQIFIGDGTVPVIDCLVLSALDNTLEENAFKWCSLFASRNQRTSVPWPLMMIATWSDKATDQQKGAAEVVYNNIKDTFKGYFWFPFLKPFFIDARNPAFGPTSKLQLSLSSLHAELLAQSEVKRQPAITQTIEEHLPALRSEFAAPVIRKERFIEFMQPRVRSENTLLLDHNEAALTDLYDKALQYLSGFATVLAFSHVHVLARDYVVIDPPWLLSDIVGRLMAEPPLPGPFVTYDNGFADKNDVIAKLETKHAPGQVALEMCSGLGFCLQWMEKVLNPSKLTRRRQDKHWRCDPKMTVHGGRRLKCKGIVAIANAFFPHLQVHFYHRYLTDYEEELPMWSGGIRLVSGRRSSAEALIEADSTSRSIDIVVRGRAGSDDECAKLLHELTDETLFKASEISPGSQITMFYLSSDELSELSPAGLTTTPVTAYSSGQVIRALQLRQTVTDGRASRAPEDPSKLLLWPPDLQERLVRDHAEMPSYPLLPQIRPVSEHRWVIALRNLARAINTYDECTCLTDHLALNRKAQDLVSQLRHQNPLRLPSDIAFELLRLWLLSCGGSGLTTDERRATLHRLIQDGLRRSELLALLEDELVAEDGDSESEFQQAAQGESAV